MEEVLGLGGIAIAARDPQALALWYRETLGLHMAAHPEGGLLSIPAGVPESLALRTFAGAGGRSGPSAAGLTLRVRALDALVRQLQNLGVKVDIDPDIYGHGVFARLLDPEGNAIVLWEAIISDARD